MFDMFAYYQQHFVVAFDIEELYIGELNIEVLNIEVLIFEVGYIQAQH